MSSEPSEEGARKLRGAAFVAVAAIVAFLPSLWADYVYDDQLLISENPYAQSLRFLGRTFRTHLWDVQSFGSGGIGLRYYRPFVGASYVINWWLVGGAAWGFHLVNVVCHAITAWLVTRAAIRWTDSAVLGVVAGLVFALHPTRTESVIWIAGRTDVFMALFTFVAVDLADRAARAAPDRVRALSAGVVVATILSILSKEAGAFTFLFVLVDWALPKRDRQARRRLFRTAAGLAALGGTYLLLRAVLYPVRPNSQFELTPGYGLLTIWAYVERIVFPWPQTFFYRPLVQVGGKPFYPTYTLVLGGLVAAGYSALLIRGFRRDRAAFLLLLASIVLLGPLLNFSYTSIYVTTSDHFLYLPLFTFAAGVLRLYRAGLLRVASERWARLLFVGALSIYVMIDGLRVFDYRSNEAHWQHEVEVNPENPVALNNLAGIYGREGDPERAYELMRRATAPASTRFFLLSGGRDAKYGARARTLTFEAAVTADGDVRRLEHICDELLAILATAPNRKEGRGALGTEHFFRDLPGRKDLAPLAADTALVATRVGRTALAAELVAAVKDDVLWEHTSPLNVVLTAGRIFDFARARRLLGKAAHPPWGHVPLGTPEELAALGVRLAHAEELVRSAAEKPADQARMARSLAYSELGAFIPALRELRPAFERRPHDPDIDPLYVQLLVQARLDGEALRVAGAAIGPEHARQVVEQMRSGLSPRVRSLRPPEEPSPWWNGSGAGP